MLVTRMAGCRVEDALVNYPEDTIFSCRPYLLFVVYNGQVVLAVAAVRPHLVCGMDSGSATPNDAAEITARLRAHRGDGASAGSV